MKNNTLFGFVGGALCAVILVTFGLQSTAYSIEIQNGPATNITATNAWLVGNMVSTNTTNATMTCYYGTGNGGTNPALWQYSNYYDIVTSTGLVSILTTNSTGDGRLTPATWYYFRWTATDTTNTVWASTSSNFTTLARSPTNYPDTFTNWVSVVAPTNGTGVSPTNLWYANRTNIVNALSGLVFTGNVDAISTNLTTHIADTNNPHAVTTSQLGAATTAQMAEVQGRTGVWNQAATDGTSATGAIAVLQASTGVWNTASTDASAATNDIVSIKAATNAINTRVEVLEEPCQAFTTNMSPDSGGTCTITYACGSLVRVAVSTNITLTFDNTDYPTNGVNRVGVEILALTNSVAFATARITNAAAPTGFTNGWVSLFFRKSSTNILWNGRQ